MRDLQNSMHATFSQRILDKSDKSNMLQVGQIKHFDQFPWGLLYLLYLLFSA